MADVLYPTAEDAKKAIKERFRPGFYVEVSKDLYFWHVESNVSYTPLHICMIDQTDSGGFKAKVSGVYKWDDLLECSHCRQRWPKETILKIETIKGLKDLTS